MSTHPDDRGLGAVARVRQVREQDSRIGLRLAAAEAATREDEARLLQARMAAAPVPAEATPGLLLAARTSYLFLGDDARDARDVADRAHRLAGEAHQRWDHDRGRLAAVEHLLERRAERRRAEAARRAAKDSDDFAALGWLRRREAQGGTP